MTVEQFFNISEIMQQDTARPDEIVALWAEGGVDNVAYRQFVNGNDFNQDIIQAMPLRSGLGLAYTRADHSGHMVVLAKDNNGIVKCIDYQQNPPKITNFPPEENIISTHVFYKIP